MVQRAMLVVAALAVAGCEERPFSFAGYWVPGLVVPARSDVRFQVTVDAEPDAWPPRPVGQAVRLAFAAAEGGPSLETVRLVVLGDRTDRRVDSGVNVLDLFEGCEPALGCHDELEVIATCAAEDDCEGGFGGDAYIATRQPGRDAPADALTLWIGVVSGTEPVPVTGR